MKITDFTASANITIDDFVSLRKEYREEYFYNLCSTEKSSLQIKKLFLLLKTKQLFDNELLSIGLLSAIEHKQKSYVDLLMNFAEANKINFNRYDYTKIFNCSFHHNNEKLIEYFDTKFNIINKNLSQEVTSEIDDSGTIFIVGCASDGGHGYEDIQPGNYLNNTSKFFPEPLTFSVSTSNDKMLNLILERANNQINPILIEQRLVDSCYFYKNEEALFLVNNESTRKIIKESNNINLFLNEPTQFVEMKKEIKTALLMFELKDSLSNNVENKINRPKI